jgi:DNA replication protein DnaC
MTTTNSIDPDLHQALKRLKLGKMLDTLPERLAIAKQQKMAHQELMLLVFHDEIARRDAASATSRSERARLDPEMQIERWDSSASVVYDVALWNDLVTLRFLDEHAHVAIVGPVGTGKTFLAHALGHIATRRGHSVLAVSADHMLKALKHARIDNSHGHEMKKLVAVDLLIVDDFALDAMDQTESRDVAELLTERHRAGSVVVTSNRAPDEWLATFADPVRAQSTIDRFVNNAYDLVIEGESYRPRLKPSRKAGQKAAG